MRTRGQMEQMAERVSVSLKRIGELEKQEIVRIEMFEYER